MLAGILTHYYYLFFIFFLYLVFLVKFLKEKDYKKLIYYTLILVFFGIISLIIFPYIITHMFFGYRGKGVIKSFGAISKIFKSIILSFRVLNYYGFNNLLIVILGIILVLLMYVKIHKTNLKITREEREILNIISIPAILFFVIVSIASPWKVLRYIVPVCNLIFIVVIYYFYKLLENCFNKKRANFLMIILFLIMLVSPFIFNLKPELWYNDKKDIVEKLSKEYNLPTIYLFESGKGKFLDDILLFSKIDESYICKNPDYTKDFIKKIIKEKNIQDGIIIFINERKKANEILEIIKNVTEFKEIVFLQKLNSCDVYCIK